MAGGEQQGAGHGKKSAGRLIAERFQRDRLTPVPLPFFAARIGVNAGYLPLKGFSLFV
jgi:hypothetical protein